MILVIGGAGYIGTHTCVLLKEAGEPFMILDNFYNSSRKSIDRLAQVIGEQPLCIEGDVRDEQLLETIFKDYPIKSVIHFAASKYMGESMQKPLEYYDNNLVGLITLLKVMEKTPIRQLLFSSSCGVYGVAEEVPVTEKTPKHAINPYGWTKVMCEQILEDVYTADPSWTIGQLRYFNPIGAHESGLIGEEAKGVPNTLLPYLTKVASKELPFLRVFGGDYPTVDGTPVRDYLHVMDLVQGHVLALNHMRQHEKEVLTVNLGTGQGTSVLEMIAAFENASGIEIPYKIVERRAGDAPQCWANPALAEKILGWKAERDLEQMLKDAWRWQQTLDQERI